MIQIEKLKRAIYENGPVKKINEIIDALNDVIDDSVTQDQFNTFKTYINNKFGDVNTAITNNGNKIAANKNEIDALKTRATTIEGNVATNTSDIATLKNTVGDSSKGLVKQVNTNTSDIATLKNAVSTNASAIQTNVTNIQKNADDIEALKQADIDLRNYIDAADFLNMAPKIGYYQEDEVQVAAKYNINNIENSYHTAPVITTDNTGKEVMYFIANDGGPDRMEINALRKAYRMSDNSPWVYYNTEVIPYCLRSEIGAGGKIMAIAGCDNDYLVVLFNTGTALKWYLIHTKYSFDETEWDTKDDVTGMVGNHCSFQWNNSTGKFDFLPSAFPTEENGFVLHCKYIPEYGTFIVFKAISSSYRDRYWYQMNVYNFSTKALIRSIKLEGFSYICNAGNDYSFAIGTHVNYGTDLTDDQWTEIKSLYTQANAHHNVFYMGINENTHIGGQALYLHDQETLVITCLRPAIDTIFSASSGARRYGAFTGGVNGKCPITFKIPKALAQRGNTSATYTLRTGRGSYNATEGVDGPLQTEIYNLGIGLNNAKTGYSQTISYRCNNTSYDSFNKKAYYEAYDPSGKTWCYGRLKNTEQLGKSVGLADTDKYAGLFLEKYQYGNRVSDASEWGKAINNGGLILWDKIILPCTSAKANGTQMIWFKKWRTVQGHAADKYVEPMPGIQTLSDGIQVPANYIPVSLDDSIYVIRNAKRASSDVVINNPYYSVTLTSYRSCMTSCRMSNGSARYFHAEYYNNGFDLYEFKDGTYTDSNGQQHFKLTVDPVITKVPNVSISASDFSLTNGFSDDAQYILRQDFRCIYNPMADNNKGIFLIPAVLDYSNHIPDYDDIGNITKAGNHNFKHVGWVAVKSDGTKIVFDAPSILISSTDWGIPQYDEKRHVRYRESNTLFITSAMCLDANRIVIGFNNRTSTGDSNQSVLYTFNWTNGAYTCVHLCNNSTGQGMQYGTIGNYEDSMYRFNAYHYGGPNLGIVGLGIVAGEEVNYFATYHNNIRTQKPLISGIGNTVSDDAMFNIRNSNNELDRTSLLTSYKTAMNIYTMFLQAASGLLCYIPVGPIFLGGYYSVIEEDILVMLEANRNTGKIGSTVNGVLVSEGRYDGNYVYLERDPEDRTKVIATANPVRVIYNGSRQFNRILLAKVETDDEKAINITYYPVNIGYNDYKFNA